MCKFWLYGSVENKCKNKNNSKTKQKLIHTCILKIPICEYCHFTLCVCVCLITLFFSIVLGTEPRTFHMLDKHSTTPQPFLPPFISMH